MSEVRQDPLTGRRVIIAEDRAGRPDEFDAAPARRIPIDCPFCAGSEHATPASLAVYPAQAAEAHISPDAHSNTRREGEHAGWQVRVVPNKFPATGEPGERWRPHSAAPHAGVHAAESLFKAASVCGSHEVIIESPDHVAGFSQLTPQQAKYTFVAYRDRMQAAADAGHAYAIVFKNVGAVAGASLQHAHSQLIALPFTPPEIETQVGNASRHHQLRGSRLLCEMTAQERKAGVRMVAQTDHFAAFCPFASRFAYEVWIAPRQPVAPYQQSSCGLLKELAALAQDVTQRLQTVLRNPAYNFVLHNAPFHLDKHVAAAQQWRLEIFPRITRTAGFEWGAGCFINPVLPERAARELREADIATEHRRPANAQTRRTMQP